MGAGAAVRILRVLLALPPGQSEIRNPHGEAMRIDAAEVQQDVACNKRRVSMFAGRNHLETVDLQLPCEGKLARWTQNYRCQI